eukprot:4758980-Alexandrium_andersonii.AAC.1
MGAGRNMLQARLSRGWPDPARGGKGRGEKGKAKAAKLPHLRQAWPLGHGVPGCGRKQPAGEQELLCREGS